MRLSRPQIVEPAWAGGSVSAAGEAPSLPRTVRGYRYSTGRLRPDSDAVGSWVEDTGAAVPAEELNYSFTTAAEGQGVMPTMAVHVGDRILQA